MGYENSGRKRNGKKAPLGVRPKPRLIVPASEIEAQKKYIRNAADERAFASGCRFNPGLADHIVEFFPTYLCHSQGKWAGEPFELSEWWIENVIAPVFGWVNPDGTRRFRDVYCEIGKKNGKSAVTSGIGLYMLLGDSEAGAHCYSFGADSSQAAVVHSESISMVKQSPQLAAVLDINETTGKIKYTATDSFFARSSSAKRGKSGIKSHFLSCDELHEWFGRGLWDDIEYAGVSRTQPLRLAITNSGKDLESVCYEQRTKAMLWESGEVIDDSFFGLVMNAGEPEVDAEIDAIQDGGDCLDIAKALNPMLGIVQNERDFLQQVRNADTPPKRANLKRYRYCVWVESCETPLLETGAWGKCKGELDDSELIGAPCAAALDLGEINDPTALALLFPELDADNRIHYRVLCWNWAARKKALDKKNRNKELFRKWELDSLAKLKLTEGNVTDFGVVRADIVDILDRYKPSCLLFDPRNAEKMTQEITDGVTDTAGNVAIAGCGVTRISFAQGLQNYAEPTLEFEKAVAEGRIVHDGNPLLNWEMNHCGYEADKDGNKKPMKPGGSADHRKVDSVQTVVMAISGCMHYVSLQSAYTSMGSGAILI